MKVLTRTSDGRPIYYVLDERGEAVPFEGDITEWADRTEFARRLLTEDNLIDHDARPWSVITAFLGIDEAAMCLRPADKPAVFGTLVRGGAGRHERREYFSATRDEALQRHERVVRAIKEGRKLEDEDRGE